jgi:streptomycin 6-kinase
MTNSERVLQYYSQRWNLSDPLPIASTFTSEVYKVRYNNSDAVLKILNEKGKQFEVKGAEVLRCFSGRGAVHLLAADEGAHLLEYADGQQLKSIVMVGNDIGATEIICNVINALHSYVGTTPSELISMHRNFRSLFLKVKSEPLDSIYVAGARVAERLIETEQEIRVLHGDIHHENILESSQRGWLAIDPQCVTGERTYEVANTFYNPNGFLEFAESDEIITQRLDAFSQRLHLEPKRLLEFAFAYGCLSASWCVEDGQSPESTLRIAKSIYSQIHP